MTWSKVLISSLVAGAALESAVLAQDPCPPPIRILPPARLQPCPPPIYTTPCQPWSAAPSQPAQPAQAQPAQPAPGQPQMPSPQAAPQSTTPMTDMFAQAPSQGTGVQGSFAPNMMGDIFGTRAGKATVFTKPFALGVVDPHQGSPSPGFPSPPPQFVSRVTLVSESEGFLFFLYNGGPGGAGDYRIVGPGIDRNGDGIPDYAYLERISSQGRNGVVALSTGEFAIGPDQLSRDLYHLLQRTTLLIPSPAGGGAVGRTKISEDNNPLPRDRVIFNYDYFNNVPLNASGFDVHRFSPGFEKTFLNGNASIEVRLPFASTLDTSLTEDGASNRTTLFGNVNLTLKALLYRTDNWAFATGFAANLPTAKDVRLRLADGTDVVRIENESVILTPYVATLWTPNDRLFAQSWLQVGFDVTGSPVSLNPDFQGLVHVGDYRDQTLLMWDTQVGYWMVQRNEGWLTGLAPFVELHLNSTLNSGSSFSAGGFSVAQPGSVSELNLSCGVVTHLGQNTFATLGVAMPLRDLPDRSFDYQIGFRLNYYFGSVNRGGRLGNVGPTF